MIGGQEYISEGLQKELDQRIKAAGGNIPAVRAELQKELHALEAKQGESDGSSASQVQVALILAEMRYLDALAQAGSGGKPKHSPNLWQRMSSLFDKKSA
jgi:hypothetical protein